MLCHHAFKECLISTDGLLTLSLFTAMAMLCYIVLLCCFTAVPARIIESPADANVLMPDPVALICVASGVPPANFTWEIAYLNGATVFLTESSGDITIMTTSTTDDDNREMTSILCIDSTERLDTGNYTCIAENEQNDNASVSDPAKVNVFGKRAPVLCCVTVCVCYSLIL